MELESSKNQKRGVGGLHFHLPVIAFYVPFLGQFFAVLHKLLLLTLSATFTKTAEWISAFRIFYTSSSQIVLEHKEFTIYQKWFLV